MSSANAAPVRRSVRLLIPPTAKSRWPEPTTARAGCGDRSVGAVGPRADVRGERATRCCAGPRSRRPERRRRDHRPPRDDERPTDGARRPRPPRRARRRPPPVARSQRLGSGSGSSPGMPCGRCNAAARSRASRTGGSSRPGAGRWCSGARCTTFVRSTAANSRIGSTYSSPHPQREVHDADRVFGPGAAGGAEHGAGVRRSGRRAPRPSARNETDVLSPSPWSTTTCSVPATGPANATRPAPAATTGRPGRRGEVGTAVPGAVARPRGDERTHDPAGDRPDPGRGRVRGRVCRRHRDGCGHEDERDEAQRSWMRRVRRLHRRPPGRARAAGREAMEEVERQPTGRIGPRQARSATGAVHRRPVRGPGAYAGRSAGGSMRRPRSCRIAFVWIWQTRLSVTPSTVPISRGSAPRSSRA